MKRKTYPPRMFILATAAFVAVATSGCMPVATAADRTAGGPASVLLLFDVMESTSEPGIREDYGEKGGVIVDHLPAGSRILVDVITSNSVASARLPVDITVPRMTAASKPLKVREAQDAARAAVKAEVEQLLKQCPPQQGTDLLQACRYAGKVLHGLPGLKLLVIFSDMVHQTMNLDFTVISLGDDQITAIIDGEANAERLPDLTGVYVWVVGAGAKEDPARAVPRERSQAIEAFWLRYFDACGASLPAERYAPTLLHFELPVTAE